MGKQKFIVLIVDDDEDDRILVQNALDPICECRMVPLEDGQDLMDYLDRKGKYADPEVSPRPDLIILDLNMPRKDGFEAIKEIRNDGDYRLVPIIVLSTSKEKNTVAKVYELGANAAIGKPITLDELEKAMSALTGFWMRVSELPPTSE